MNPRGNGKTMPQVIPALGRSFFAPICVKDTEFSAVPVLQGFSKRFFATEDPGVFLLRFRDTLHGGERTDIVEGTGRLRERFCYWFFRLLEAEGIRTHLARSYCDEPLGADGALLESGILVSRLEMVAIELVARFVARGHWVDAHKFPVLASGTVLEPPVTEFCLKWQADADVLAYQRLPRWQKWLHGGLNRTAFRHALLPARVHRDDPRIGADMAIALHHYAMSDRLRGRLINSHEEAAELRALTLQVNFLLRDFLRGLAWVLEDGKFEVGVRAGSREFIVADEYSQDSARVRDRHGNSLTKDLHRKRKSKSEIHDGYARLTEAIEAYAR